MGVADQPEPAPNETPTQESLVKTPTTDDAPGFGVVLGMLSVIAVTLVLRRRAVE
ncbi:PGF-CTERM sorting domain-containing protein (plasmid) [Haloferacaceae archaeon DSL9]